MRKSLLFAIRPVDLLVKPDLRLLIILIIADDRLGRNLISFVSLSFLDLIFPVRFLNSHLCLSRKIIYLQLEKNL